MPLSGLHWIEQFPTSRSTNDLTEPFRTKARNFIAALIAADATVVIGDTLRPPQRAHLMYYSFQVAHKGLDPAAVPAMAGVDIQWVHPDASGIPDLAASRAAALAMVNGFGIVFEPALHTRHTEGLAIDMTITWPGDLTIARGDGTSAIITSLPRDGGKNLDLRPVGLSYGVVKLATDPPHWSVDGH